MSSRIGGCACAGCLGSYIANGPDSTVYSEGAIGVLGSFTGIEQYPVFVDSELQEDRFWSAQPASDLLTVSEKVFGGRNGPSFPRGSYFIKYCSGAWRGGSEFSPRWFVASDDGGRGLHVRWNPIASETEVQFSYGTILTSDDGRVSSLHGFAAFVSGSAASKTEAIRNAACLVKPFYHAGGQISLTFPVPIPALGGWPTPREGTDWPRWRIYQAKPLLFPGRLLSFRPGVAGDATRYDIRFPVYSLSRGRWWANTRLVSPNITGYSSASPQSVWWAPKETQNLLVQFHSTTPAHTVRMNFDDGSGGSTGMPGAAGSTLPPCSWNLTPILKLISVTAGSPVAAPPRRRVFIKIFNSGLGPTTIPLRFTFQNTANVTWDSLTRDYTAARLGGIDNPNNYGGVFNTGDAGVLAGGVLSAGLIFNSGTFAVPGGASFSGDVEIRFSISNGAVNYGTFSQTIHMPGV